MTSSLAIFADETYPAGNGSYPFRFGAIGCEEGAFEAAAEPLWHRLAQEKRNRVDWVLRFIERARALAVVSTVDAARFPLQRGCRHELRDIGSISRADHVWSVGIGFTFAATLAQLASADRVPSSVHLLMDAKALREKHWDAMESSLRRALEAALLKQSSISAELVSIARIPKSERPGTWRRLGSELAHLVTRLPDFGVTPRPGTYLELDLSKPVEKNVALSLALPQAAT